MQGSSSLMVDVVSDIVCPWCFNQQCVRVASRQPPALRHSSGPAATVASPPEILHEANFQRPSSAKTGRSAPWSKLPESGHAPDSNVVEKRSEVRWPHP